jgi:hypothetical protein
MTSILCRAREPMPKIILCLALIATVAPAAYAKGGATYEIGFNYHYETGKSPISTFATHEIQIEYLRPFRFLWAGLDLKYVNSHNSSYATNCAEFGGMAKYWIVDPGDTVGLNIFSGLAIGKENTGTSPVTTTTFKAGPELAWFIADGVSISTRIQYSTRRAGPTFTVIGLHSGLSLFF